MYKPKTQFEQFMVSKLETLEVKIDNVVDINKRQNSSLAKHQIKIDQNTAFRNKAIGAGIIISGVVIGIQIIIKLI